MEATTPTPPTRTAPGAAYFAPRRLGHANVYIRDYEKAYDFYHGVVGFEEVYRQPDNRASFISNGNTYHDMALTDVTSKYAPEGQGPGLFHIAFELENEVELVDGYRRAVEGGVHFRMTQDHDVAHSLYQSDPDGNGVEFYADVVKDWRTARNGVFSKKKPLWIPGVTTPPVAEARYPVDPEIRVVADSVFRARRVTHVGFVTRDFEGMFDYYTGVAGLKPLAGGRDEPFVLLTGSVGGGDIVLHRGEPGEPVGMLGIGIEVKDEAELDRALSLLPGRGIEPVAHVRHPARRTVCIHDPDGLLLQFYVNRDWRPQTLRGLDAKTARHLL